MDSFLYQTQNSLCHTRRKELRPETPDQKLAALIKKVVFLAIVIMPMNRNETTLPLTERTVLVSGKIRLTRGVALSTGDVVLLQCSFVQRCSWAHN